MSGKAPRVGIIGAGMSGMLMAIKLKQAGHSNFVIFEKSNSIGGVWRDNRYPGVACDVASFAYCYAFEPKHDWSHRFSPGPEIYRYFQGVADKYQLHDDIRYETEVLSAEFRDQQWHVETGHGECERFDVLVAATGPLNTRIYPDIPGIDEFEGHCFHSADWQDDVELGGKRIGVIGTGSSAVQMTDPLSQVASDLSIFQRTPQWIMGTANPAYSPLAIALKRRFPLLGTLTRKFYDWVGEQFGRAALKDGLRRRFIDYACRKNLNSVADPELRRRLTPDHQAMCKRMIVSSTYYPALQKPHVHLVTEGIERITANGVLTKDGILHELDALILATGFDHNAWNIGSVVGEQGVSLEDAWNAGTRSYYSITVPGFPNYFMLIGPNSPITNLSLIDIADIGVDYILQCIEKIQRGEFVSISPRAEVTEAFMASLRGSFGDTVWITGCDSWYFDQDGLPATWPWYPSRYRKALKTLNLDDYDVCVRRQTDKVIQQAAG